MYKKGYNFNYSVRRRKKQSCMDLTSLFKSSSPWTINRFHLTRWWAKSDELTTLSGCVYHIKIGVSRLKHEQPNQKWFEKFWGDRSQWDLVCEISYQEESSGVVSFQARPRTSLYVAFALATRVAPSFPDHIRLRELEKKVDHLRRKVLFYFRRLPAVKPSTVCQYWEWRTSTCLDR